MQQNNSNRNAEIEIDLMKLLREYLKYWWLILLCVAIAAGAMFVVTVKFITPVYRASCSLYINNSKANVVQDIATSSNMSAAQNLVPSYIETLKTNVFLSDVAACLGGEYEIGELKSMISAEQKKSTQFLNIYVKAEDPMEATRIATVVYELVPQVIPEIIDGSSAKPIDYPEVPTARFSPSYRRNVLIGAFIGIVLAVIIITLRSLLDVRIRTAEDLENLTNYPVLGRIPEFASVNKKRESYGYGSGSKPAAEKEGKA